MITGNKKASPARLAHGPQYADNKVNPSIPKKQRNSTVNIVRRLDGRLCLFDDYELLLEWINRQSLRLEILNNRRRVNG